MYNYRVHTSQPTKEQMEGMKDLASRLMQAISELDESEKQQVINGLDKDTDQFCSEYGNN